MLATPVVTLQRGLALNLDLVAFVEIVIAWPIEVDTVPGSFIEHPPVPRQDVGANLWNLHVAL